MCVYIRDVYICLEIDVQTFFCAVFKYFWNGMGNNGIWWNYCDLYLGKKKHLNL